MSTLTESLLIAALEYAALGWHVLPLADRDKIPRVKEWQHNASTDEKQIEKWWSKWPSANIGVQLGKRSKLIDVECDSEQAEANILRLFDDDPPVTCCYVGMRGKHRLFQWRDDLPGGAVIHIAEIEVRTGNTDKGAQSVFPPSIHPTGKQYRWLVTPDEVEPAELPKSVVAKLWNLSGESTLAEPEATAKTAEDWARILGGVSEGTRNQDMASLIGKHLRMTVNLNDAGCLQVIRTSLEAVNARNRPPMDGKELLTIFASLLRREQQRRIAVDAAEVVRAPIDQQIDPQKAPADWKLVIVRSDPPLYELHAPHFAAADGGCLRLTAEQMNSGRSIRIESLRQAEHPLRASFDKAWSKKDGIYERLVLNAEHAGAPLEAVRWLVVAERLRDEISTPYQARQDGEPEVSRGGRPSRLEDGSIVFKFTSVWEDMSMGPDKIKRTELSAVLVKIGATNYTNQRLKKLTSAALAKLDDLLADTPPDVAG